MGEYAEMMLDGTCCEGCGVYLGNATGFPGYCSAECAGDRGLDGDYGAEDSAFGTLEPCATKFQCPDCDKTLKTRGLAQHFRDAHGMTWKKAVKRARSLGADPNL